MRAAIIVLSCLLALAAAVSAQPRVPVARAPKSDALFPVKVHDKYGCINREGRIVIKPQFDWPVGGFSEGLAVFVEGPVAPPYDKKEGYIGLTGKVAIEPQFVSAREFSEGLACVLLESTWGFIDKTGRMVITFKYGACDPGTLCDFSEGWAHVIVDKRHGFIDRDGRIVIPCRFEDAAPFHEGLAMVKTGDLCGYIGVDGKFAIQPRFREAGSFSEGLAWVMIGKLYGYIDRTGKVVIQPEFGYAEGFSEGLAHVAKNRDGYVDKRGRFVIGPKYRADNKLGRFSEGLASVCSNDKWGYIDKAGKVAIEPRFDSASDFKDGLAAVTVGRKSGYIDHAGRYVWKPTE